jgi:hypothetical protein
MSGLLDDLVDDLGALELVMASIPETQSRTVEFHTARTLVDAVGDVVADAYGLEDARLEDALRSAAELAACAWRFVLEARMASAVAQRQLRSARLARRVVLDRWAGIERWERAANQYARVLKQSAHLQWREAGRSRRQH